jgi:hypothetical protein
LNVDPPADRSKRAELVHQYREAGATWWIELEATGQLTEPSVELYRQRIRRGPPEEI